MTFSVLSFISGKDKRKLQHTFLNFVSLETNSLNHILTKFI